MSLNLREIPLSPIEKLDDSIFVNDKIITYKTASALLGINTKESQEYFEKYLKECVQPEKKVFLTYILGGVTDEGKRKVIIVTHDKYEEVKNGLKDTFIDKIYSIQKSDNITWESIFNIDDFLYTERKIVKPPVNNNHEVKETKNETRVEKKGSISSFFNQPKQTKPEEKKPVPKPEKKKNDIKNMFSKVQSKPKTNGRKIIDDDDDEEVVKTNKKRSRVIDDDDDDSNSAKHVKSDILDSDNESEKENIISDNEDEKMDVDGPESDGDLFNEPPPEEKPKEKPVHEPKKAKIEEPKKVEEPKIIESKNGEDSKKMEVEEPKKVEEPKDLMYEDDDGFFVTEKTSKKRVDNKPFTEEEKKEIKKELAVQKQKKKEVKEKLTKNTNQKTLFNFFKKA